MHLHAMKKDVNGKHAWTLCKIPKLSTPIFFLMGLETQCSQHYYDSCSLNDVVFNFGTHTPNFLLAIFFFIPHIVWVICNLLIQSLWGKSIFEHA